MLCPVKNFHIEDGSSLKMNLPDKKGASSRALGPEKTPRSVSAFFFPSLLYCTVYLFLIGSPSSFLPFQLCLPQKIFHCLPQMNQRQPFSGAFLREFFHLRFVQRNIPDPRINCFLRIMGTRFDPIRIVPALFLSTTCFLLHIVHDLHFLSPFIVSSGFHRKISLS